jgi:predicted nucleic acid-binding protein
MTKLGPVALANYDRVLRGATLITMPIPTIRETSVFRGNVNEKDQHVVASAVAANASFLLTLDRGLIAQSSRSNLPLTVLTPETFIKTVLPEHADYDQVRR